MKIKKLSLALSVALILGVGAFAGLKATQEVKEAKAAGGSEETHAVYIAVASSVLSNYTNPEVHVNTKMDTGEDTWRNRVATDLNDTTTYSGYKVFAGQYSELWGGYKILQFQIYDTVWKEQVEIYNGDWSTTDYAGKTYFYGGASAGTWTTGYTPASTVTVTGYGVFDDVLDDSEALFSDSTVISGSTYSVPGRPALANLKHFVGWFTDDACTVAYTARTVSDDLTLYAKVVSMTADDSYFYWIDKDSSALASGYVYFWGEYETDYDGIALADCKVSDVLYLNGEGKLYKIPAPAIGNYNCLIHNSADTVKSFDMTVTLGAVYYTEFDNNGGDGKAYYRYSASDVAGLAADFLVEAEELRNGAPTWKGLNYSICGILPSDAAELYGDYEELAPAVKSMVDASYTYTYKAPYDGSAQDNILFSAIMAEIYNIALKDATFALTHSSQSMIKAFGKDANAMLIIVTISAMSLIALGTFFLLKKKKVSK